MEFLMGAAGAVCALALFAAGAWAGRRAGQSRPAAQEPPEAADPNIAARLRAEQAAFESMLGYNQDTAYGLSEGGPRL